MDYISLCSCYLVLFFFQLFQWLPTAYRIKLKTPQPGIHGPTQLVSLSSSHSTLNIQKPALPHLHHSVNTKPLTWRLFQLSHSQTSCLQANSYFSTKLRHPSFSASSPLAFLLCPMTLSLCRLLLQSSTINIKCLCISLSLNCKLDKGMAATKLIHLFFFFLIHLFNPEPSNIWHTVNT